MLRSEIAACVLLLGGCAGSEPPPGTDRASSPATQAGVEYRADTQVLESFPVQLRATVTLLNRTGETVMLELPDGCPVLLRAYREGVGSKPAWDQGNVLVCTLAIQEVRLAPGESRTFQGRSDAREILGDSLPDGSYRLTAVVRPNGSTVELPAGSAQLAVPR